MLAINAVLPTLVVLPALTAFQGGVSPAPERVVSVDFAGVGGAPVRRTNTNVSDAPLPQNEVSIAIDPANPLNLVVGAHDYRSGFKEIGAWASFDGGRTWKGGPVDRQNPALSAYDFQGDSTVAAHRMGVFYYGYIDHNTRNFNNRLCVARSMDGGVTWPGLGVVADNSGGGAQPFEDKPYIAIDNSRGPYDGNVYVAWVRAPSAGLPRLLFSRSSDEGRTYSVPSLVRTGFPQGPVPAIGPQGEVFLAWRRGSRIELVISTDGGLTFGSLRNVASVTALPNPLPGSVFRVSTFPTLAVDRSGGPFHGSLYVAWADRNGVGSGPDVLLSRSTDGGISWSAPVRVSDDANASYQFFPWMAVGPDGIVSVVFHDRRESPRSRLYHTYIARSSDGGLSFGPNVRVSDEISDSALSGLPGDFIGDYIGIAASPLGVYPAWTDCRVSNGQPEVYVRPMRTGGMKIPTRRL